MRPISNYGSLEIVRPLLGVWRSEIDHYLEEHRLKFRDDATNEKLNARRNRMRHQIIPWLEKQFGRNIRVTIWRAATVLAEEEDFLETLTPGWPNEKWRTARDRSFASFRRRYSAAPSDSGSRSVACPDLGFEVDRGGAGTARGWRAGQGQSPSSRPCAPSRRENFSRVKALAMDSRGLRQELERRFFI